MPNEYDESERQRQMGQALCLTDPEREALIGTTGQLARQGSPAVRRYWWSMMKALINARSPAQVSLMELEKGLRAA
jgi:hypothetical protein